MSVLLYIILGKILGVLVARYGYKFLGKERTRRIIEGASKMLGDAKNPITDVTEAMKQALIEDEFKVMGEGIAELERQKAAGDLRIAAAEAAAREGDKPDVTVVPLDGTEKWTQPYKDPK